LTNRADHSIIVQYLTVEMEHGPDACPERLNSVELGQREGNEAHMTKTPEKLLTVDEVAEILQVSPTTVYRRIQAGELPAIKLGHRQVRIKPEDLEAYIEAHRITGEQAESESGG